MKRKQIIPGQDYAVAYRSGKGVAPIRATAVRYARMFLSWVHPAEEVEWGGEWTVEIEVQQRPEDLSRDTREDRLRCRVYESKDWKLFVCARYFICPWDEWIEREKERQRAEVLECQIVEEKLSNEIAVRSSRGCDECQFYRVQCLGSADHPCPLGNFRVEFDGKLEWYEMDALQKLSEEVFRDDDYGVGFRRLEALGFAYCIERGDSQWWVATDEGLAYLASQRKR